MRLRDLRWHILAAIVIIIAYGAISLSYYLSIKNGKVETSMKAIALEVSEARSTEALEKINSYYEIFTKDETNSLVQFLDQEIDENKIFEECKTRYRLVNKFDNVTGNKILIARESIFNRQNTTEREDSNYYVYFQKPYEDSKLTVRIKIDEFFNFKNYDVIVFDDTNTGSVAYVSYTDTTRLQYASSIFGTNYINYFEDGIFSRVYTINDKSSVVSAIKFEGVKIYLNLQGELGGLYIATIIPTSDAVLGSEWILNQALIFYFVGVAAMILMLGLMVIGAKHTSMLLRADRRSVKGSKAMAIRITKDGDVIYTNDVFKKFFGPIELDTVRDVIDVATNKSIMDTVKDNKTFICKIKDSDGKEKYLELISLYISNSYYLMGNDVTLDYNERMHALMMSGKNEYTNCDNAFVLSNKYDEILGSYHGYDIAFIEYDIYKFDEIIGVFGQTSYSELLKVYLAMLREMYQDNEIYQLTDSKFMVIYPNTSVDAITKKVTETLDTFKRPLTIRENNIYVNSKVIIYNFKRVNFDESDKISLEEMRKKLDLAYRNMKSISSKDYIIYDSSMDDIINAVDEMERDIEIGLENNEFEMYLQPQFDVVDNKIVGAEALIRWNNPKYFKKSPQAFIELAEQRGHMLDIGKFVITESFALAKKLEKYGITISVNVSPVQLLQVGFVQTILEEFERQGVKPNTIAIELTETLLMENFNLISDKLKLLREKGIKIHLDDFLTGYSSMLYLKDLPIDALKIDKEFTKHVETNKTNEGIVKAIIDLAKHLDLGLVCEGVETKIQKDIVKKMGCRVIQGYLISKPVPYDEAVALIESYANGGKK